MQDLPLDIKCNESAYSKTISPGYVNTKDGSACHVFLPWSAISSSMADLYENTRDETTKERICDESNSCPSRQSEFDASRRDPHARGFQHSRWTGGAGETVARGG